MNKYTITGYFVKITDASKVIQLSYDIESDDSIIYILNSSEFKLSHDKKYHCLNKIVKNNDTGKMRSYWLGMAWDLN